jgi:hypothetical protein
MMKILKKKEDDGEERGLAFRKTIVNLPPQHTTTARALQ